MISLLASTPKSDGSVIDGTSVGISVGVSVGTAVGASVGGADVSVGGEEVAVGRAVCACLPQADKRKINTNNKIFVRWMFIWRQEYLGY